MVHLVTKAMGGAVAGIQSIEVGVFETHYHYLVLLTDYGVWVRSGLVMWVVGACD